MQIWNLHNLISGLDIERQSEAALLALARILLILIKCLHCLFDERSSLLNPVSKNVPSNLKESPRKYVP